MAITKVVLPDGKPDTSIAWGKPQRERVIPDWVASTVTQVLMQNMLYGTGRGAHVSGRTDAGKTGTTDNYADAWFSGYTPRLEATVWIGYPQGEVPMLDVHGIAVSGPTFPADIWHLFMEAADATRPDAPFPAPTTTPVWVTWKGQFEYGLAYGTTTTTTTVTKTKPAATTAAATTATVVPTTTAATTTASPPPDTTTTAPDTTDTTQTTTP
jgi:membrane peptidoglycan carboxypeptidase